MKSISKLAMVVLLLAASYKMYGQSGFNCTSGPLPPQFLNCEADCQAYLAECQAECYGRLISLDHVHDLLRRVRGRL
jgi:hypothetical protein